MNTFLPYSDIIKSVQCLDNKRLGKQRVEAYQILRILNGLSKGWVNHPAVKLWRGCETCLEIYMNECITEWKRRGFRNTMFMSAIIFEPIFDFCWFGNNIQGGLIYPNWFGNKDFHDSHKSNLLRKYPEYYSQFNWNVPNDLPYVWPVK